MELERLEHWLHGILELMHHAWGHSLKEKGRDRNFALVGFDQAIEVSVNTYLDLSYQQGERLDPRWLDDGSEKHRSVKRDYWMKVEFILERLRKRDDLREDFKRVDLKLVHRLRNQVYHKTEIGTAVEKEFVEMARDAAVLVLKLLFNYDYRFKPTMDVVELVRPTVSSRERLIRRFLHDCGSLRDAPYVGPLGLDEISADQHSTEALELVKCLLAIFQVDYGHMPAAFLESEDINGWIIVVLLEVARQQIEEKISGICARLWWGGYLQDEHSQEIEDLADKPLSEHYAEAFQALGISTDGFSFFELARFWRKLVAAFQQKADELCAALVDRDDESFGLDEIERFDRAVKLWSELRR